MNKPQDETAGNSLGSADIKRLLQLLPHRYPFLMVDRLQDMDGDNYGVGIKNVTINEPHFMGHFPGEPIMPGILLIEGMAQTAGALCASAIMKGHAPKQVYFMTIDKARFRKPVRPGDRVYYYVRKMRNRNNIWKFRGEAFVEESKVAEAEIGAMLIEKTDNNG